MIGLFFFQAEDGIRDGRVTGVQTCALPILAASAPAFAAALGQAQEPGELVTTAVWLALRSEERRVGKSVDLGGRRINKKKTTEVSTAGKSALPKYLRTAVQVPDRGMSAFVF